MFVDLQVNGYGGVDFNGDDLDAAGLRRACEAMARDGVIACLATIISDHLPQMRQRLARLAALRAQDALAQQQIVGLHIEGPFLNPQDGYRGAHPLDAMRPAEPDAMRQLLDAGEGLVRLVTLAPECDAGARVIRLLADQGILVSAGHTNATLDQLRAACDAGLSMFTHLGNGCPALLNRHDNIIQRTLSLSDRLTPCFIADGVHVPFFALGNYLRWAGVERCVVVSDAMAAAGLGPGRFRLARWTVEVGADGAAWAPDRSHLVGSAMSLRQAEHNLRTHLQLTESQCRHLLYARPAAILGLPVTPCA